jgi:hypothetical protein
MGIHEIAAFLESVVCIAFLGLLLLKYWSDARLDAFRQEMFTVRDELFDYAASGKIEFDSSAYRLLRQMMNGYIRYGHQLTFFRINLTMLRIKLLDEVPVQDWSVKWDKALKNIADDEVRKELASFHERAMECAAKRVVFGSPLLIILSGFGIAVLLLREGWRNLARIFAAAPTFTFSRVFDPRIIESEAAATAVA